MTATWNDFDPNAWYSDPPSLRLEADKYDRFAARCRESGDEHVAGAWESKARAFRSRALILEGEQASRNGGITQRVSR